MVFKLAQRDDILFTLALALPLALRLYHDGADFAPERLAQLAVTLIVAHAWAFLFARASQRPIGTGLVPNAILFTLLLPGPVGWGPMILALSFGHVFGREVFGGRPVLPPALVSLAFALFSFSDSGFEVQWLFTQTPDFLFAGACLPGAVLLIWKRLLAAPAIVGAVLGTWAVSLGLAELMLNTPAWWEHAGLGGYTLVVVFIGAHAETAPRAWPAQFVYGLLLGALILLIRLADPTQPDGVIFAALLTGLFAPLVDRALSWRPSHA